MVITTIEYHTPWNFLRLWTSHTIATPDVCMVNKWIVYMYNKRSCCLISHAPDRQGGSQCDHQHQCGHCHPGPGVSYLPVCDQKSQRALQKETARSHSRRDHRGYCVNWRLVFHVAVRRLQGGCGWEDTNRVILGFHFVRRDYWKVVELGDMYFSYGVFAIGRSKCTYVEVVLQIIIMLFLSVYTLVLHIIL